jgi:hypothetical protein
MIIDFCVILNMDLINNNKYWNPWDVFFTYVIYNIFCCMYKALIYQDGVNNCVRVTIRYTHQSISRYFCINMFKNYRAHLCECRSVSRQLLRLSLYSKKSATWLVLPTSLPPLKAAPLFYFILTRKMIGSDNTLHADPPRGRRLPRFIVYNSLIDITGLQLTWKGVPLWFHSDGCILFLQASYSPPDGGFFPFIGTFTACDLLLQILKGQ